MYTVKPTSQFKKDLKLAQKRGYNIQDITDIIKKLAAGETLPEKNHDHPLTGNFKGCREKQCTIHYHIYTINTIILIFLYTLVLIVTNHYSFTD